MSEDVRRELRCLLENNAHDLMSGLDLEVLVAVGQIVDIMMWNVRSGSLRCINIPVISPRIIGYQLMQVNEGPYFGHLCTRYVSDLEEDTEVHAAKTLTAYWLHSKKAFASSTTLRFGSY